MKVPHWDKDHKGYTHVKFIDGTEKFANYNIGDFTQFLLDAEIRGSARAHDLTFYA